jgi:hypothetical protein
MGYDEAPDERLAAAKQWARPVFTLLEVHPQSSHHIGGGMIAIKLHPNTTGDGYCKFDTVIVKGVVNASGFALCQVPPHHPGAVAIFFSKDQRQWSGPIAFHYQLPTGFESLVIFAPMGIAIIVVGAIVVQVLARFARNRGRAGARGSDFQSLLAKKKRGQTLP